MVGLRNVAEAGRDAGGQRPYWIASHVHVRITPDGCVLLDLRRDRYFGLGRDETALLATTVNEWPTPLCACAVNGGGADASARSRALCDSLLGDSLISGYPPAIAVDRSAQEMDMREEWVSVGDELDLASTVRIRDILNFLVAFAGAWISLKCSRMDKTVETVRRSRNMRRSRSRVRTVDAGTGKLASGDGPGDIFRLARAVDVFRRMRTYVFAAEGRCLLHALTLTKFLSRYGLHTHWVIGVRTQPWGAHSWVQWQRFLVDTTPEKVGQFLPILVV
jgi:hypothetical protein